MATINLSALYLREYFSRPAELPQELEPSPVSPFDGRLEYVGQDPNGPVWQLLAFGSATDPVSGREFEGLEMNPSVLITISHQKHVVKTQITGGDGSVKEFIAHSDPTVRIRGFLWQETNDPPIPSVEEIETLRTLRASVPVTNQLINAAGIDQLLIETVTYEQVLGFPGIIKFEIQAVGDAPAELQIKEGL